VLEAGLFQTLWQSLYSWKDRREPVAWPLTGCRSLAVYMIDDQGHRLGRRRFSTNLGCSIIIYLKLKLLSFLLAFVIVFSFTRRLNYLDACPGQHCWLQGLGYLHLVDSIYPIGKGDSECIRHGNKEVQEICSEGDNNFGDMGENASQSSILSGTIGADTQ